MVESTEQNKRPALWLSKKLTLMDESTELNKVQLCGWVLNGQSIHNQGWIEYEHEKIRSWREGSENVCEIVVDFFLLVIHSVAWKCYHRHRHRCLHPGWRHVHGIEFCPSDKIIDEEHATTTAMKNKKKQKKNNNEAEYNNNTDYLLLFIVGLYSPVNRSGSP